MRQQQRHRAGGDHLGGGAAQTQEVRETAVAVGAHHQHLGAGRLGALQQRPAAGAARHGAGVEEVDLGLDAAALDIVAQDAMDDAAINNSPRRPTLGQVRSILESVAG